MTARDGFTRLVDTWLAEEGTPTTPDYLDLVLDRTSTTRQRPVWLSPGRWLPVNTTTLNPRAYSIPPVARFGLLTALLIALASQRVALYAGSQRHRVPSPFGPAANGQHLFRRRRHHRGHEPRRERPPHRRPGRSCVRSVPES